MCILRDHLDYNLPEKDYNDYGFKWEVGAIEPRKKWLQEQIKKLEDEK